MNFRHAKNLPSQTALSNQRDKSASLVLARPLSIVSPAKSQPSATDLVFPGDEQGRGGR